MESASLVVPAQAVVQGQARPYFPGVLQIPAIDVVLAGDLAGTFSEIKRYRRVRTARSCGWVGSPCPFWAGSVESVGVSLRNRCQNMRASFTNRGVILEVNDPLMVWS